MSALLDAVATAPRIGVEELLHGHTALVVVAPHPDDETLGCGALMHDAARLGVPVHVVCLTDGSASHPNSLRWPPPRLAARREAELRAAVTRLAPTAQVTCLRYPDCGLPSDAEAGPCTAALIRLIPPGALVTVTWEGDPHEDHVSAARLVGQAAAQVPCALRAYPIWGRFRPCATPRGPVRVEASAEAQAAKREALACHATQMTALIDDDPKGFVMKAEHQRHFLDHPEILLAA
ncbi:PIG-L deacetylase family protein [Tranquillimonas alkanivorans]|uniref:N-acetylglucosaminyl deacetylase, LmbE family n=1 Tax=Tranquillimonas alkanivorans TaxID=441119 RepID=A0A1I5SBF8_9RHOB|nr:PIG-L family deacetylase [Tranquillimonas alkanivorans]SFP68032.1 N-acetylglucosaminyl deacetylase, LmbE family [Tranquillimonas alkanivorans]